ncbi:MAG: DUF393 domain-containing protein [Verrucomicrobiae bacterium]|nr:DUF393 domain-containing protein [Verrucomicrobiae bacterium]
MRAREKTIWVYDGQCRICRTGMRLGVWLDRNQLTRAIDYHREDLESAFAPLTREACSKQMQVLHPDGRVEAGWDGIVALGRLFPWTRWIAPAGAWPPIRALGRWAYRWLAAHRHHFGSCSSQCAPPDDNPASGGPR